LTINENNTNFSSLIKNLENNPKLYELVFKIIMNEQHFSFSLHNPVIQAGITYGIILGKDGRTSIHNRIYEQLIYNYMSSKLETSGELDLRHFDTTGSYIGSDGKLNIQRVIRKFQLFMKEQYSQKDNSFIERNGRLLFMAFIKPIINGEGFDFKEVQISEEKRLDIVITYAKEKHIVELKLWRGEKYHQKGIQQLWEYLDLQNMKRGYLVIYDLRKESGQSGKSQEIEYKGKKIFVAWV